VAPIPRTPEVAQRQLDALQRDLVSFLEHRGPIDGLAIHALVQVLGTLMHERLQAHPELLSHYLGLLLVTTVHVRTAVVQPDDEMRLDC
jgi:hypothetical protein